MAEFETTVMREDASGDEQEVTIFVEYSTHKAYRGARDSLCGKRGAGPPLEPDEPAGIDIEGAKDENGKDVELSEDELRTIEEAIISDLESAAEPDFDPDRDF